MPLSADLLQPIPGDNPSGENLYRTPLFSEIKESRRQEEAGPQGLWEHDVKTADFNLVAKLCGDALKNKTKDLFLATWLAEALTYRDSFAGLKDGLDLLLGLIENFWDTLYPEIEDGDAEFRASPLEWFGNYLDPSKNSSPALALKLRPVATNGVTWLQYSESRKIPTESEAAPSDAKAKKEVRAEAKETGKLMPEEVDVAVEQTPKAFYAKASKDIADCTVAVKALDTLCGTKFGDFAPSFGKLRGALEEVGSTVSIILRKKRELEPDPVEEGPADKAANEADALSAAAPSSLGEIKSREDAVQHVLAAVRFLRTNDPRNPAGYLIVRALRFGELRGSGAVPDPAMLAPAPVEIRTQVKRAALEARWPDVLNVGEQAAGLPCGRAWLDLHRYVIRACEELGEEYAGVARAIRAELRALLMDYPGLPEMFLMDDTPTANLETQKWLRARVLNSERLLGALAASSNGDGAGVYERAMEAVQAGNAGEAIDSLSQQLACADSGRSRFIRKVEMAQVLMAIEKESIAYPILKDLTEEIETRKLDEWESRELVARPLALMYRCMAKLEMDSSEMADLLTRICKLDVAQALSCQT